MRSKQQVLLVRRSPMHEHVGQDVMFCVGWMSPVWRLQPFPARQHGHHVRAPVRHFASWLVRHTRRLPRQRPPSNCTHGTRSSRGPSISYTTADCGRIIV